jgi:hypothetical protein
LLSWFRSQREHNLRIHHQVLNLTLVEQKLPIALDVVVLDGLVVKLEQLSDGLLRVVARLNLDLFVEALACECGLKIFYFCHVK